MKNGQPMRVNGDASVMIAVNIPSDRKQFKTHVKRITDLLGQWGYECGALTPEGIVQMADDIQSKTQGDEDA